MKTKFALGAVVAAVHAHAAGPETLKVAVPPSASTLALVGVRVKEQVRLDCVTVNVCPAIVRTAVRAAVPVFAVTLKASVLVPLPLPPEVTVTQLALLDEVQAHPEGAVTVTVPVPAAAPNAWLVAEMV